MNPAPPLVPAAASQAAFDTAVTELAAKVRGFIRRRVRDEATADDLTQETLLKVFRSRAALRDGQRIEAWLYRIARTTLIDFYPRTGKWTARTGKMGCNLNALLKFCASRHSTNRPTKASEFPTHRPSEHKERAPETGGRMEEL